MSEANCGISVHEVTQVRVSDSEGNAMNPVSYTHLTLPTT